MKTILFLLTSSFPFLAHAQHSDMWKSMEADSRAASIRNQMSVDSQMQNQHIDNLARQVELNRLTQPSAAPVQAQPAALSPELIKFIQEKEAEYNKLLKKYNALLLVSLGAECSDKQAAFDASLDLSHTACAIAFPCYSEKSHPIHELAGRIYEKYDKEKNPIVCQSNCPWVIYSEAARQLGIKPLAKVK